MPQSYIEIRKQYYDNAKISNNMCVNYFINFSSIIEDDVVTLNGTTIDNKDIGKQVYILMGGLLSSRSNSKGLR